MTPRKPTRVERRRLVEAMLVEDHTRSDRSIARASGASHTHVADCRKQLVAAGRIAERPCRPASAVQADGNLTRQAAGEPSPRLAHGAWSEARVAPLREGYLAELRAEFPSGSERRLLIQAHRLAQLELLGRFTDERGVIRSTRTGEVFAAAALGERLAASYLAEHERLELAERERSGRGGGGAALRAIEAELTAGDVEDAEQVGGDAVLVNGDGGVGVDG
jgi:hypothetical protein